MKCIDCCCIYYRHSLRLYLLVQLLQMELFQVRYKSKLGQCVFDDRSNMVISSVNTRGHSFYYLFNKISNITLSNNKALLNMFYYFLRQRTVLFQIGLNVNFK